jgi:hypothetical protein
VIGLAAQLAELTQSSAIARLLEDACHVVVVLSGAVWLSPLSPKSPLRGTHLHVGSGSSDANNIPVANESADLSIFGPTPHEPW